MLSIYILCSTSWIPRCPESLSPPVSTLDSRNYLLSTQCKSHCLASGISRPFVWTIRVPFPTIQLLYSSRLVFCLVWGFRAQVQNHQTLTGACLLDLSPHSHLISFIPRSPANPRLVTVLDNVPRRGLAPLTDRGLPSFPNHGWTEYPSPQSTTIQDCLRAIEISDPASCLWVC